jgi:type I restriction enzyme R subunit
MTEQKIEQSFIDKLTELKYTYRPDITNRAALEANFREQFETLNRVRLTEGEFARLLDEIATSDVFMAARTLRERNAFTRDDGTPLNYTLVNIKDWCKNTFEVANQLRINTDYSHHRYDVLILIAKHDAATGQCRFNALLATASITTAADGNLSANPTGSQNPKQWRPCHG